MYGFQDFHFQEATKRDAFGPTPSIKDIRRVVMWAGECRKWNFDEFGWNFMVHGDVLKLSLYKDAMPSRGQLVGITPWYVSIVS